MQGIMPFNPGTFRGGPPGAHSGNTPTNQTPTAPQQNQVQQGFSGPRKIDNVAAAAQQQPNQQATQQSGPPAPPPPKPIPPEAAAHVSRAIQMARSEKTATLDPAFVFASSFYKAASRRGLSEDGIARVVCEVMRQDEAAGSVLLDFAKRAAYKGNIVGYKVDTGETKREKVLPGNQLWRRREKKKKEEQQEKTAFRGRGFFSGLRGKIRAPKFNNLDRATLANSVDLLSSGAGGAAGYLATPHMLPHMDERALGPNKQLNAVLGSIAGFGGGRLYSNAMLRQPSPTATNPTAVNGRFTPGAMLYSGTTGIPLSNFLADQIYQFNRGSLESSNALIEAARINQDVERTRLDRENAAAERDSISAQREQEFREQDAREKAEARERDRSSQSLRTAGTVVGGLGALGLGAYGIYGIIRNIMDRRENKDKPSGMIRLTLPRADGREVLVEVPKSELPMYMQRQLGTDLRRSVRTGLEDRRRARRQGADDEQEEE